MRNEYVDMSEVTRRMQHNIIDRKNLKKQLKWTKEHCKEGTNYNAKDATESRERMEWRVGDRC